MDLALRTPRRTNVAGLVTGTLAGLVTYLAEPLLPSPTMEVHGGQLVQLMIIGAFESLAVAAAVWFAIAAFPHVRRIGDAATWTTYVSVIWLLASWWPHDKLHARIDPHNMGTLLKVEWGFHVTLVLAGIIVGKYVYDSLRGRARHAL